jgi:hypothetical protein
VIVVRYADQRIVCRGSTVTLEPFDIGSKAASGDGKRLRPYASILAIDL